MSMKNSNATIWNRTSDLPICSRVPELLCHHQRSPLQEVKEVFTSLVKQTNKVGLETNDKKTKHHQYFFVLKLKV
jgi:hypothetical protein